MVEKKDKNSVNSNNVRNSIKDVIWKDEFQDIVDDLISYSLNGNFKEINNLLVTSYNNFGKQEFNLILESWVAGFLKEGIDVIVSDDDLETMEQYHDYLKKVGYLDKEVEVSREDAGLMIRMKGKCPYSPFCEEVEEKKKKCIRGTVLKYLLSLNDTPYSNNEQYTAALAKIEEKKKGYFCELRVKKKEDTIDDVFKSVIEGDEVHPL